MHYNWMIQLEKLHSFTEIHNFCSILKHFGHFGLILAVWGLFLGWYDAQGHIFLLFLLSYNPLRLQFRIFYSLEDKISLFFIIFYIA